MITLDRDAVLAALEGADLLEDALYEGYSGRAMYGERCFGIVGSDADIAGFCVAYAAQDIDTARELHRALRTDSMGVQTIGYFPGYTVAGEED